MKKYIGMFMVLSLVAFMGSYCFAANQAKEQGPKQEALKMSGTIQNGIRVINITASKNSFEPDPIIVKLGEKLRLVVASVNANHALIIPAFRLNFIVLSGKTKSIEFVADNKGSFPLSCYYFYGNKPKHLIVRTSLIVE